jgi:hypothetical protein
MSVCEDQAKHEFQLEDLGQRVSCLEERMKDMEVYQGAAKEQSKTIFMVLDELKMMLTKYTNDMKEAMFVMSKNISERLDNMEKDVQELKGRNGRKWDQAMMTLLTVLITAAVTYVFSRALK